ncbi:MAG: PxKF domain-containing protein, partial [Nitrososphaera sp.]
VDKTAPSISADVSPAANANNWHNADVTVTFTCGDGLSGLNSCTAPVTLISEGTGQMATGEATDNADNSASVTVENINIDKTAPTISAVRTPANSYGWNNGPVEVDFDCSDGLSGIDSCGPDATVSGEGAGQSVLGTALDFAGNSATTTVGDINNDLTSPVNVAFSDGSIVDGGEYYFGFVPNGPTMCSAQDALSGFDHCDVAGGGTVVGDHMYTATAYDKAGNSAIATIMYTVNPWTIFGFYQPVDMGAGVYNAVRGGSTVPLKFEAYAGSMELTDTSIKNYLSAKRVSCVGGAVIDDIEEYISTGQTMFRYDETAEQFIDNWKVPNATKGTCYEVKLATIDGSSIVALFKIK